MVVVIHFFGCGRDETFDIMVFDKETQFVELFVYDYDMGSASDFLGKVTLNLDTLPNFDVTELDLDLLETETGTLQLVCEYTPLKKTEAQRKEDVEAGETPDDVLFDFSPTALSTDLLEQEVVLAEEKDIPVDGTVSAGEADDKDKEGPTLHGMVSAVTGLKRVAKEVAAPSAADEAASPLKSKQGYARVLESPRGSAGAANRGVLTVSCIRGRNFKVHSMLSSTVRPYVIFTVGNTKRETAVQKDHHDPAFDEIFNFVVHDPVNSVLHVKVMHDNRLRGDSQLADLFIRLNDVSKHKGPLDQEYVLNSKQEEMYLSCRLEWSSTV
jgi:hypothetical protein